MQKLTPQDLQALIEQFQDSHWKELHLTAGDTELFLSKDANADFYRNERGPLAAPAASAPMSPTPAVTSPAPAAAAPSPSAQPAASGAAVPDNWVVIPAPSLGTFYRAPKPGAPAFCDIGQPVTEDSELCLIEVMKLFTSVRAKVNGTIREICVKDGEMVEFDQPLFLIEPNA